MTGNTVEDSFVIEGDYQEDDNKCGAQNPAGSRSEVIARKQAQQEAGTNDDSSHSPVFVA
jgi:hypothetical protein